MPVLYAFFTSGPLRAFTAASEESSFEPGGRGNLLVFGSISLMSHPLAKRRACTRTNQFDGATTAHGQPSFDKGSTASIAGHGQHSVTTHSS